MSTAGMQKYLLQTLQDPTAGGLRTRLVGRRWLVDLIDVVDGQTCITASGQGRMLDIALRAACAKIRKRGEDEK